MLPERKTRPGTAEASRVSAASMEPAWTVTFVPPATTVRMPLAGAAFPRVAELPEPSESTSIPETFLKNGSAIVPVSTLIVSEPSPPMMEFAAARAVLAKEKRSAPSPPTRVMARVCRGSCRMATPSLDPMIEVKPARCAPAPSVTEDPPPPGRRRVSNLERFAKRESESWLVPPARMLRVSFRTPPVSVEVAKAAAEARKRFACVALPARRALPADPASSVSEPA